MIRNEINVASTIYQHETVADTVPFADTLITQSIGASSTSEMLHQHLNFVNQTLASLDSKMNVTSPLMSVADAATSMSMLETCAVYDFVVETVLMGLLCLLGFVGNILSVLCLRRNKSKTATPFLLMSLEVKLLLSVLQMIWKQSI